jgi:hypothetical protein
MSPLFWATSSFKKSKRASKRSPIGEKSPNLVTLTSIQSDSGYTCLGHLGDVIICLASSKVAKAVAIARGFKENFASVNEP